jgi:hypothetical protein
VYISIHLSITLLKNWGGQRRLKIRLICESVTGQIGLGITHLICIWWVPSLNLIWGQGWVFGTLGKSSALRSPHKWSHCQLHHTHQPFVYNTKYCWWHITKRWTLTHMYSFLLFFSLFSDAYYILFYTISLNFLFTFWPPPPPPPQSATLGSYLVCLVVKLAVAGGTLSHGFTQPLQGIS